jgi:prepilin-type N-terminal cleavage/methylation domain-containing protein
MKKGFILRRSSRPERREGFTLVELLVVVSIITILSSVGLVVFNGTAARARDTKRKEDLKNIAYSLFIYYQSNNRFPCTSTSFETSSQEIKPNFWLKDQEVDGPGPCGIKVFGSAHLSVMPYDPLKDEGNPLNKQKGYSYSSGLLGTNCPGVGQYFILATQLEDKDDSEVNSKQSYRDCSGGVISDPSLNPNLYVVTSQN